MAHGPADEFRVQVTPIETGYTLSVEGLRQFVVADGYEGSLDQVARGLIAKEVGQQADTIAVCLHYDMMERYGRPFPFSWGVLVLGLATLAVAVLSLVLLNPVLASIGGVGTFLLIVTRLLGGRGQRRAIDG